jgi:hypothetical protein
MTINTPAAITTLQKTHDSPTKIRQLVAEVTLEIESEALDQTQTAIYNRWWIIKNWADSCGMKLNGTVYRGKNHATWHDSISLVVDFETPEDYSVFKLSQVLDR